MHIPLVYEQLFYKYFVRRSVGPTSKGKRASLLMDVVILVYVIKENKDRKITCSCISAYLQKRAKYKNIICKKNLFLKLWVIGFMANR